MGGFYGPGVEVGPVTSAAIPSARTQWHGPTQLERQPACVV